MERPIIVLDQSTKATGYCFEVSGHVKWGVIKPSAVYKEYSPVYNMVNTIKYFYDKFVEKYEFLPFVYLEHTTTHMNMKTTLSLGGLMYGIINILDYGLHGYIMSKDFINNFLKVKVNEYGIKDNVHGNRRLKDGSFPVGLLSVECKIASVLIANRYIREFHPDKDILTKSEHDTADAICLYLYIKEINDKQ